MFKVNLFVHSAGRRLDQRSRRMLAVVSLPSQRSVRPRETTACYKQQTVQADMFSKTICNPFQSSSGLSIRACFCSCRVIYTFFCRFERWFHSIFRSSYCQDFEKCRDIPPLSMCTAVNSFSASFSTPCRALLYCASDLRGVQSVSSALKTDSVLLGRNKARSSLLRNAVQGS